LTSALPLHGFTTAGHDGFGLEGAQSLQRGRPLGQLSVAGVDTGFVFHQVTAEQHFFFFHPSDGVAASVAITR
jgi:hypothetical protein